MTRAKILRGVNTEAGLLLIGIPVLLWTAVDLPCSVRDFTPGRVTSRAITNAAIRRSTNFEIVFRQKHHFLYHFWLQMWNCWLSCATAVLTDDRQCRGFASAACV